MLAQATVLPFGDFINMKNTCKDSWIFSVDVDWPDLFIWHTDGNCNAADATITSLKMTLLKIADAQLNGGSISFPSTDYEVTARTLGFTTEPPDQWSTASDDAREGTIVKAVHPHHQEILWLKSVDLHWQCHSAGQEWRTMIVTFIPRSCTRFIRNIAKVPLYCQGECVARRLVYDKEAFT